MGVLFISPNWAAPSELWLQRMIEGLLPHIVAIGADSPMEPLWHGRVPSLRLFDPIPPWDHILRRLGLPVRVNPSRRSSHKRLKRMVNSDAVSVILVHYLDYALRFEDVWATTDKPLFVHCHGYDTTWDIRSDDDPSLQHFSPGYLSSVRRLAQRATIIANSSCCAQRLLDAGIPVDRVVTKYLGVPVPEMPHQRTTHTSSITILYLGRLMDCKGPDLVIRAFELACDRGLDAQLVVAGDGVLRDTCESLRLRSTYRESITLCGAVDAPMGERLRRDADIFTAHNRFGPLSHQEEAFGVSIVEAMAAALPVVSGRSGGLVETVVEGETGLLVEPGDIGAHAEAFLRLAQHPDLRLRMGKAGWQRARDHFSQERERSELIRILNLDASLPVSVTQTSL